MTLVLIIIIVLFVLFGGGYWGYRSYGPLYGGGWIGLVLIILLILFLTGNLHGLGV